MVTDVTKSPKSLRCIGFDVTKSSQMCVNRAVLLTKTTKSAFFGEFQGFSLTYLKIDGKLLAMVIEVCDVPKRLQLSPLRDMPLRVPFDRDSQGAF